MEPIPDLTVVIPTFNERGNVAPLIERLRRTLEGIAWRAIFVDDSSADGTAAAVKAIATTDDRVLCLQRVGRRGLAGAVIEGIMASSTPIVAVMDADLQHDETLLPLMLASVKSGAADLVIGSRYMGGGSADEGLSRLRGLGSRLASRLARLVLKAEVNDPVSGFFMIRREVVDKVAPRLSTNGFKILFDIIASQDKPLNILELPYVFAHRHSGESKLDGGVVLEYLGLILARFSGNIVPPRALLFFMVGASGLIVNIGMLKVFLIAHLGFGAAQLCAAVTAMTTNFLINNQITYRDRRLRGLALLTGYIRFCALCGVGLVANVAVAALVFRHLHNPHLWWLAGVAGAVFGAVWNYVGASLAVW